MKTILASPFTGGLINDQQKTINWTTSCAYQNHRPVWYRTNVSVWTYIS